MFGVLSARHEAFARPIPPKDADQSCRLDVPEDGPYDERIRPLADVPEALVPKKRLLLDSWDALRAVTAWNSEALAHVLHVLIGTIADPYADTSDVPAFTASEPPPRPKPTAAHPRAYRGTKYKPPKPPRPNPTDLRPHLCVPADEDRILARLSPHFEDAISLVERDDAYGKTLRSRGQACLRAYGQCWPPECRTQIAAVPASFRRDLLWNLRDRDWEHVSAALAAYWALDLDQEVQLRRCISILVSINTGRQAVDWCQVIARMPLPRRVHFAELLIESSAHEAALDDQVVEGLTRADHLSSDSVYRHRMFYALSSVKERANLAYPNDGFVLANDGPVNHKFTEVGSVENVAKAVQRFADYVHDAENWWPTSPISLWEHCSRLEGLRELLEAPDWRRVDPHSAVTLLGILSGVVYEELDEEYLARKWRLLRGHANGLLRFVEQISVDYRHKALDCLSELVGDWADAERLGTVLEPYLRLLARLCGRPFQEKGYGHYALTAFTTLPPEQWRVVEQAEDASFRKFEAATTRKNDAWLIGTGLWSLCEINPGLAAAAFDRFPQQLLKAAQTLGVLDFPARRELVRSFAQHPLSLADPLTLGARGLVDLVEEHVKPGISNPIPRRLKEHLRGSRLLQPSQVDRDVALIRQGWLTLQLDVLNQLAFDRMSHGLPETERTSQVKHALMLQQVAADHRRSLRRLLKAYLGGEKAYAEDHPKNQEWLARHSRIEPSKWLRGIDYRGEVPDHGVLDLAIERDPLEVLRLGSYFGTCLGVGGGHSYSAAAITLDVNKQVVYARNTAGRVVARQLLAVAQDDRLICFTVYPKRIAREVRALFREFDKRLAVCLGLDIYEPSEAGGDDGYKIEAIVSCDFWDDDAWDFRLTTD